MPPDINKAIARERAYWRGFLERTADHEGYKRMERQQTLAHFWADAGPYEREKLSDTIEALGNDLLQLAARLRTGHRLPRQPPGWDRVSGKLRYMAQELNSFAATLERPPPQHQGFCASHNGQPCDCQLRQTENTDA
jgi:hypothetical protein